MKISERDELRRQVFETSPTPIVIMDAESNCYIDCNQSAIKIYGYHSLDEVVGKTPLDVSAPVQYNGKSASELSDLYIRKAKTNGSVVFDWKHQRPDGTFWDAEVHLHSLVINNKQLFQFSLIDQTERKFSEKTQKLLYDLILDLNACNDLHEGFQKVLMSVLQFECLDCGGIYIVNHIDNTLSLAAHHGLSDEFILHVSVYAPDSQNALLARSGEARYGTYSEIRTENDAIRQSEGLRALAFIPIMAQGNLVALLNCASHTSDTVPQSTRNALETIAFQVGGSLLRLRTASDLKENQDLFELFMFHSPIYSFIKEVSPTVSRVLQASDSFKTLIGVSGRDIRGKTMQELFPTDFAAKITADDQQVVANKEVLKLEEEFDGRYFTTIKFPIVRGNRTLLAGYTIDITERRLAEIELEKANYFFEKIIDGMPGIFYLYDSNYTLRRWNYNHEVLLGYTAVELSGRPVRQFFKTDDNADRIVKEMDKIMSDGGTSFFEGQLRHNKGHEIPFILSATRIQSNDSFMIFGFGIDITDRKRTEDALMNTQKLESLGVLAGGIAHDFNNLMGGIFGFIELAIASSSEESVRKLLTRTMQTIDRTRNLTQQLLTFAKGGSPIQEVAPLFPFIQQTAQFALSGSSISCHFNIAQDLWSANYDKNQLGQVFDNLIINAQQAMPLGGVIELSARNITIAKGEHPILKPGDYVRISVTDTGVGIPQEIQKRIFDPFFTTKTKGHGLGLATCYSIINRHGGCIDVYSEPGKGSTFKVYLPASTGVITSQLNDKKQVHKGEGTFLIMDDEEVIRDIISAMLVSFGYTVVCTQNGKEAVDYVANALKNNRTVDVMLFDLTVPGAMGGKEAIDLIRKMHVTVPAFVASGYADDPIIKNPMGYGFTGSISKPFMRNELIELLEKHMKSST
jgi:PAS domain S-box-containing protein